MARQMTRDVLPQACLPAVAASLLAYALVLQTAGERSEDADDWRAGVFLGLSAVGRDNDRRARCCKRLGTTRVITGAMWPGLGLAYF